MSLNRANGFINQPIPEIYSQEIDSPNRSLQSPMEMGVGKYSNVLGRIDHWTDHLAEINKKLQPVNGVKVDKPTLITISLLYRLI